MRGVAARRARRRRRAARRGSASHRRPSRCRARAPSSRSSWRAGPTPRCTRTPAAADAATGRLRARPAQVDADRTDPLADAVDERLERVERAAVRRSERDDLPRDLVTAEHVDVVRARRARPSSDRRTRAWRPPLPGLRPEPFEHRFDGALELLRVVPVRQAPVVREPHVVRDRRLGCSPAIGLDDVERVAEPVVQPVVPDRDRPDPGDDVHVGHQLGRDDAVAGMLVADAVGQSAARAGRAAGRADPARSTRY